MKLERLIWAVTNQCNFSCSFCYAYSHPKAHAGLSGDDLVRIAHQINESTISHLCFIGGEPLTRPDLLRIMKEIRSSISINLDSNGSLIRTNWNDFYSKRLNQVSIGFDGPPDLNEIYRQKSNEVIESIKFVLDRGVSVGCPVVVHNKNYLHIEEIVEFLFGLGVGAVKLNKAVPVLGKEKQDIFLSREQEQQAIDTIKILKGKYPKKMGTNSWYSKAQFEAGYRAKPSCYCAFSSAAISSRGNFVPCLKLCQDPYINKISNSFSIPNLLTENLNDVYKNHMLFKSMRLATVGILPDACGRCKYTNKCNHGCRVESLIKTGELSGDNLDCEMTKENI